MSDKKWIQKAIKRPGALHRELNVPEGKKIPEKKLKKAENSRDKRVRIQANMARTLRGLRK